MPDEVDLPVISKNTGIVIEELKRAKEHLFRRVHVNAIVDGVPERVILVKGRMAPHQGIAEEWQAAFDGSIVNDKELFDKFYSTISHEVIESRLMESRFLFYSPETFKLKPNFGLVQDPKFGDRIAAHYFSPNAGRRSNRFGHIEMYYGLKYDGPDFSASLDNVGVVFEKLIGLKKQYQ